MPRPNNWLTNWLKPKKTAPVTRTTTPDTRARLGVEQFECRVVPAVVSNSVVITSIGLTTGNDLDNGQANHVTVAQGTVATLKVDYSYAIESGNANSDVKGQLSAGSSLTTGQQTIVNGSGIGSHATSQSLNISSLPVGTYDVKVQVTQQGNDSETVTSGVQVVNLTIVVTPNVTVAAANTVYTGVAYAGAISTSVLDGATDVSSFGTVSTAFYSDSAGNNAISAPTNAGTYFVKATFTSDGQAHNGKVYNNAASPVMGFTIAKASSTTTTIGAGPFTFDGGTHAGGSGSVSGAGVVTGAATLTYSGDQVNAGTYFVTAHYAGDANHTASDGQPVAVTINKATATVAVTGYNGGTYDAASHTRMVTVTGIGGTSDVLFTDSLIATNAGAYILPWSFSNSNYNLVSGTLAFTINKADVSISVGGYTGGTYDSNEHIQTVTVSGVPNDGTLFTDSLSGTNAGHYSKAWSYTANPNYNAANGTLAFDIAKAAANVSVNGYAGVYDGSAHGATGSATGVGGVNLGAGLNLGASFTDAPGGTAHWTFSGGQNYNDQSGDAAILIGKANATIAVTGYSVTYDGSAHTATGTATGVSSVDLSSLLSLSNTTHTNAGSYTGDTWSFAGNGNYNSASGTVDNSIAKANATVSVSGYTGVYDGAAHGATGSATGVLGESLAGLDLGASFTNVPGGTAHWTFTDATGNYNNASGDVNIVINKADAVVVVNGYSGTYDGVAHGATGTATGVNGESLGGLNLGATFTDAPGGTAAWTFSGGTNYNDANGSVEITIGKADANVSVSGYSGTYDGSAHGASGSATGVGGANLNSELNLGLTFTDAPGGTAHWTFTGGTNYNDASGDVAIAIGKADATIHVDGYTGTYDGAAHGATGSAAGIGGVNLGAGLNLGLTFTDFPGGTAHWTFSGGTNYNDQSGDVAIDISKASSTTTTIGAGPFAYDGSSHAGGSGSVSGAGVVTGGVTLTYSGDQVNAGTYFVTAHYAGDANHTASDGQPVAVTINKATATVAVTGYNGGTYDAASHTRTVTVTGVGGVTLFIDSLSGTNAGHYSKDWSFTDPNYNDLGGSLAFTIAKANATVSVSGYTGTYDGAAHGATGSATGVLGESLAGLNLGSSFTNAPGGTAHWTFTDTTGNYNNASGDASIVITKATLDFSSVTTQSSINVSSNGDVTFALSGISGIVDQQTIADLFNGATFTLTMDGETGSYTTKATVVNGVVYITMNLKTDSLAYQFLKEGVENGENSAARADWEKINLTATTNGGNYSVTEFVLARIFQTGK